MERWVLLFIAACACHKATSSDAGAASTASAAPIVASITVDGGDIPTTHAMIQTVEWGVQLFVGEGSSCQEFESHVFMGHGRHVLVDFAPPQNGVAPVVRVWHGPPFDADPGGSATIHGDLATAPKVDVDLAVTSKEAKIDIHGTVSAEVCR